MDGIPTEIIKIGSLDVEVYKWLTQEQEDQYNTTLLGDEGVDIGSNDGKGEVSVMVKMSNVSAGRKLLVQFSCKNLSWEQYNVLSPKERELLFSGISKIQGREAEKK